MLGSVSVSLPSKLVFIVFHKKKKKKKKKKKNWWRRCRILFFFPFDNFSNIACVFA
jgi:hypothetical protein